MDVIWKKAYLQSDPYCVYMSEEKTIVQANTKTANLQLATFAMLVVCHMSRISQDPPDIFSPYELRKSIHSFNEL